MELNPHCALRNVESFLFQVVEYFCRGQKMTSFSKRVSNEEVLSS